MPAYPAVPSGAPPWAGVLVVHHALGMTSGLQRQADWLAGEGFLALAPDLCSRGSRMRCLFGVLRSVSRGAEPVFDDLDAARGAVKRDTRPVCMSWCPRGDTLPTHTAAAVTAGTPRGSTAQERGQPRMVRMTCG